MVATQADFLLVIGIVVLGMFAPVALTSLWERRITLPSWIITAIAAALIILGLRGGVGDQLSWQAIGDVFIRVIATLLDVS